MKTSRNLDDREFLREIAYLYYEQKLSQEEIGKRFGYSRPAISKAIQRAEDLGIVRTIVVPAMREGYVRNLTRDIRLKLGLQDLVLVPSQNLAEPANAELPAVDVLTDVAVAAADYLDGILSDGDILALSGGWNIMRQVVRYLKPKGRLPGLKVVPTMGFIRPHANFGDPSLIAYDIANAYGAQHSWLPIPALVESQEQCEMARKLPVVRDVLHQIEQANIYMLGLWAPYSDQLIQRGILSDKQMQVIDAHKPEANINLWFFNIDGECINERLSPPPYYLTGFELAKLKDKIENHGAKVILVAGAGARFIPAIRSVLNAGIVNVLIADHVTAQGLVEDLD